MMTRSNYVLLSCLLLGLVSVACARLVSDSAPGSPATPAASPALAEDKHISSVEVVKASPQPLEIAAGGSGELIVRLTIQSGYHINANPPTYSYLKATELEIAPGEGVSPGRPVYPKPLNRKFAFADKPLAVYEGEAEVKTMLKADKSAKPGQQSLGAKLRIQACDEAVCYPPGALDLVIPITVK